MIVSAVRGLLGQPRSSAVALLVVAVGIAANATAFSVWHAVVWRALPYRDADRLVLASSRRPDALTERRQYRDWDFEVPSQFADHPAFAGVAIAVSDSMSLSAGTADRVRAAAVSSDFFTVLGARALAGRLFGAGDLLQTRQVAVLAEGFWRRRFGGDPRVIGSPLVLNGRPFVVAGIAPRRVQLPDAPDVWIPSGVDAQVGREFADYVVVLRLRDRVTLSEARSAAGRIATERFPLISDEGRFVRLTPLHDGLTDAVRPVLVLLGVCAGILLLVSCLNVAGLFVVRLTARAQEFAVRAALGASRARIASHILVEGVLLAGVGAVGAIPMAVALAAAARQALPVSLHGGADIAFDAWTFGATALLAGVTAVLVGVVPAVSMSRRARMTALQSGGWSHSASPRSRVRGWLVAGQIAAAVALLAPATTVARKVSAVMATDVGLRTDHALVVQVELPRVRYGRIETVQGFYQQLGDAFQGVAGVQHVGSTTMLLYGARLTRGQSLHLEGLPRSLRMAYEVAATPDYFAAVGLDVVAGRGLGRGDRRDTPKVVVVSAGVGRVFGLTPGDLVGRRLDLSPAMPFTTWAEIVGVVRDVSLRGAEGETTLALYLPFAQRTPWFSTYTVVRSEIDPRGLIPALRAAAQQIDPDVPLYDVRTFDEVRAQALADRRLVMMLMLGLGGFVLGQAAIGLYAVTRQTVEGRIRELGIRIALGATPARIRAHTVRDGGLVVLSGVGLGAAAAWGLWRVVVTRIPNAGVLEPAVLAMIGAGIALVTLMAAWPSIHRAVRVDPVTVLRRE